MTAEEKRRMLAAIFDTVVAEAEGSHGCYRLLTERKTGLYVPMLKRSGWYVTIAGGSN